MKVAYTRRSLEDLRKIIADCRRGFGDGVAAALLGRFERAIAQIREVPESAPRVDQRPNVSG